MYSSPVDRDREISSFRARQITKQVKQSLCVHALSVHDDDDDDCAMMTTPKQQETARFEGVRKFEFLAFSPAISLFLSFAQKSRTRIQQAGSRRIASFKLVSSGALQHAAFECFMRSHGWNGSDSYPLLSNGQTVLGHSVTTIGAEQNTILDSLAFPSIRPISIFVAFPFYCRYSVVFGVSAIAAMWCVVLNS